MTLDDCLHHYMDTLAVDKLEDYLDAMPRNEVGKQELIDAIQSYRIPILYHVLFDGYFNLLTPEEVSQYAQQYEEAFDRDPAIYLNIIPQYELDDLPIMTEELRRKRRERALKNAPSNIVFPNLNKEV